MHPVQWIKKHKLIMASIIIAVIVVIVALVKKSKGGGDPTGTNTLLYENVIKRPFFITIRPFKEGRCSYNGGGV